jgi:hemolysin activation/secretion protein
MLAATFAGVPRAVAMPSPENDTSNQGKMSKAASKAGRNKVALAKATPAKLQYFDIDDYRIDGADHMAQIDVEEAVYPFLGPHRTAADVEKARAALEKSYHDEGYQTVSVSIPPQNALTGLVVLRVTEGVIGHVRVKNARFFDLQKIKARARSLREGTLPNFHDLTADIIALNAWPDRRVTPALRAGVKPGTVDVDLNVDDKLPLHGEVEINDRNSPNTAPLRVTGTVHYDDLWQLGHSLSFTYQVAPQDPANAESFSGSYLARVTDDFSVLVYGLTSNSNVATVGGFNVVGPGQVVGARAVVTLPMQENFFHTISLGIDYKHFGEVVGSQATAANASTSFSSPVTYFPLAVNYSATWQQDGSLTQLNAAATMNIRGLGSDFAAFDNKRFNADPSFFHLNADVEHTHDLPEGYQVYGKLQGQFASGPLVSSEEFSLGGWDTVRGYYESEALGDNAVAGTIELRSPDVGTLIQKNLKDSSGHPLQANVFDEWRFFAFGDGGLCTVQQPTVGEQESFWLASYGVGTRFKALNYFNAQLALAMPVISQTYTRANDPHLLFRVWGDF